MQTISTTANNSYKHQQNSHDVHMDVINTNINGSHPNIKPNFNTTLSRNFTINNPIINNNCTNNPNKSYQNPTNINKNNHNTHITNTINTTLNSINVTSVTPNVDLMNLHTNQNSNYFFINPTLNTLTYTDNNNINVMNMSFYINP